MYQKQKILILLFLHLFFYEICSYLWRYFIDCAVSCETDTKFFFELTRRSFTMVKFFSSQLLDDTCESVSRGRICWKSSFLLVCLFVSFRIFKFQRSRYRLYKGYIAKGLCLRSLNIFSYLLHHVPYIDFQYQIFTLNNRINVQEFFIYEKYFITFIEINTLKKCL